MPRCAAFRVLVLPYTVGIDATVSYALFRQAGGDEGWHALRGLPHRGEIPLQAARRETETLAGVPQDAAYFTLDSRAAIELADVACHIAEYAFGVRVCEDEVCCRADGLEHRWVAYEVADGLLRSAADRNALWELRCRLGRPAACC